MNEFPLTSPTFYINTDRGQMFVSFPECGGKEDARMRALAEHCAKLTHKGSVVLCVCLVHDTGRKKPEVVDGVYYPKLEHIEMPILESEDYMNALESLRAATAQAPTTPAESKEELMDRADTLSWNTSCDGDNGIEFEKCSPAGEDFFFYAHGATAEEIIESVRNAYDDFDMDEHVKSVMESNGAPDLETLVKDAKEIKAMLEKLSDALQGL